MNIFCFQRHILNAILVSLIFIHHQSQKELILIQKFKKFLDMFYLNNIEQLFLLVEQLDQLEVCLTYS